VSPVAIPRITQYWHPVAALDELGAAPIGVTVLDRRLVVFAGPDGGPVVLDDLCVHRGAPLSLGQVESGCVVCPYHGWRYDADGRCVSIPAIRADAAIPSAARVPKFASAVAHGLVWVAIDDPVAPIPDVPFQIDTDPGYRGSHWTTLDWNTSAGRAIENEMDLAHFPFVHPYLLADPQAPEVLDYQVDVSDDRVVVTAGRARYLAPGETMPPGYTEYTHIFPFTHHLRIVETGFDPDRVTLISAYHLPATASTTRMWWFMHRNFVPDHSEHEELQMFQKILEQDKVVAEAVRPEAIPAEIRGELHVRLPDAPSLAFRRWMEHVDMGCLSPERGSAT
jgi:phenylpropionate dioxygenase-like ring-hydroxylating dioxygenase large terminal subunit